MIERSQRNPRTTVVPEGIPGPGDVIAGKYRVDGVLGAGGMGVVLSARHVTLGQHAAIKILVLQEDQLHQREAKLRLLREARAAAALTSDHVVRIYDMGEDDLGRPFIVMERLFGADLGDVLGSHGPLPVPHAVSLLIQASRAVGEAHALGIVHRDLKPSNLFLTRRSDGGAHVKVLDFGIAKSLDAREMGEETLTGARVTLGSPSYMSPEQVRDARLVDGRSDIWSLGAMLFELLTGKLAFHGNTLPGVCASIVADQPPVPSTLRSEIPVELDRIILRCLEKDKTRRFGSAEAFAAALEPFAVPFVDFGEMVPFSWLPETIGVRDTVAPDSEGLPPTAPAPPIESPRIFPDSHDRTLESGKPLDVPASRSRRRPGTPRRMRYRVLAGLVLLSIGVAIALFARTRPSASSGGEATGRERPARSAAPTQRERAPAAISPVDSEARTGASIAPPPAIPSPAPAGGRSAVRQRSVPREPEKSSQEAVPEIRMTR